MKKSKRVLQAEAEELVENTATEIGFLNLKKAEIKMMSLNIATLNLCLGLPNKKDSVTELLHRYNVNVCCLQETEIPKDFPERVLNCGGYTLELKQNKGKKRAGIVIV